MFMRENMTPRSAIGHRERWEKAAVTKLGRNVVGRQRKAADRLESPQVAAQSRSTSSPTSPLRTCPSTRIPLPTTTSHAALCKASAMQPFYEPLLNSHFIHGSQFSARSSLCIPCDRINHRSFIQQLDILTKHLITSNLPLQPSFKSLH